VYVVGASVDGFIAGPGGEVDFYPLTSDVLALLAATWPTPCPPTSARSSASRGRRSASTRS